MNCKKIVKGLLKITAGLLTAALVVSSYIHAIPEASSEALPASITSRILDCREGYSSVLYDNSSGLPTSEANDIVQTSDGFIWIGSYSGLIRYDGNTFERIDSTGGIASVVCLYVDSRDRLWIGTNDNGLAVMENGQIRFFGKDDGLTSESVRAIAEDSDGNIFAATTAGIAVIDNDMQVSLISDILLSDAYIRDISCGPDNTVYGVTVDGDLFILKDKVRIQYYGSGSIMEASVRTVTADPDVYGRFYIGTKSSTVMICDLGENSVSTDAVSVGTLESINRLRLVDDRIWVCADNGIGIIDGDDVTILDNIQLDSSIEEMMTDYQGNIWFASSRQGVMKIVRNKFTDIFEKYDLTTETVNATCFYNDMLFIGKDNGLAIIGNTGIIGDLPVEHAYSASGQEFDAVGLKELFAGSKIRSMLCDSRGRLWICSFGENALVRYDNGIVTRFNTSDGFTSDRVRMICERADGTFAVAYTGGVAIISDDAVLKKYDVYSGIGESDVLTIAEMSDGRLLLGTDGGGIYILSDDGTVENLSTENGLWSDVVMRIKRDVSRGIFWIVTSNSIAYMDEDLNITTVEQFPYSNNFDMYEDKAGDMWILSSNGIYVVKTDELLANGEIDPVFYGTDDGLTCIATANSYSALRDNGDLYIAGTTGVTKVNIDAPEDDVDDLKISVPYVEADGIRIYPDESGNIVIPSNVRKTTVCCYVFTYSLSNPDVIYCLDGFDDGAITIPRDQFGTVDYTNLRGGSYSFKVRLCDSHGRMTDEMSFVIIKEKSLIETWWVRISLVIVALLLVYALVKGYANYRTSKYKEKEEHDRIFIREMTEAIANTIDMKDKYTKGHSTRVAEYTSMLATEMGLPKEKVEMYYNIALLHDIGKIGIPPEVLNKPGKLSDTEFMMIKSHAKLGYNVLKHISILPELAIGAKSHHERPDGKGYPDGLVGDQIPPVARIIAVADTFDAMYSDRPYRKRMNFDKVVSIVKEVRGTQLDSEVVDAFLSLVDKGEFRAPDDNGGGSTEDINNIHKKFEKEESSGNDGKTQEKDDTSKDEPSDKKDD